MYSTELLGISLDPSITWIQWINNKKKGYFSHKVIRWTGKIPAFLIAMPQWNGWDRSEIQILFCLTEGCKVWDMLGPGKSNPTADIGVEKR